MLLITRHLLPEKLQKWVNLRNQPISIPATNSQRILFHAASGEIEYVKSIIRNIKQQRLQIEIYVSYTSPSAEKLFENISNDVTAFIALPWDTRKLMTTFIKKINPDIIVISRTDFWPEFINQAVSQKIPLIAVSVFPTMGFFQNIWLKFTLSKMMLVTAVTEQLCEKIDTLLNHNVQVLYIPDTRIDQIIHRLQKPSKFEIKSDHKICVFGSTWPQDDQFLIRITDEIISAGYQIIWCPHDISPNRIQNLRTQLKKYSVIIFSEQKNPLHLNHQILILDRIGYLADMYRYSLFSFVGGSFKSKVHSVMEPLCAGNTVFVGPYFKNNPEAIDGIKNGTVFSVNNDIDFLKDFRKMKLQKISIPQNESTQKTVDLIFSYLN